MTNPFDNYQFDEEIEREFVAKKFRLLYESKSDVLPRFNLLKIYRAFKAVLPDFEMSMAALKDHLDALSDSPESKIRRVKRKDEEEYFMDVV
tara:strand:+ start:7520 stop:7795 length:276 start_codon:yes stop_codon:yes gene_type:complete